MGCWEADIAGLAAGIAKVSDLEDEKWNWPRNIHTETRGDLARHVLGCAQRKSESGCTGHELGVLREALSQSKRQRRCVLRVRGWILPD